MLLIEIRFIHLYEREKNLQSTARVTNRVKWSFFARKVSGPLINIPDSPVYVLLDPVKTEGYSNQSLFSVTSPAISQQQLLNYLTDIP